MLLFNENLHFYEKLHNIAEIHGCCCLNFDYLTTYSEIQLFFVQESPSSFDIFERSALNTSSICEFVKS